MEVFFSGGSSNSSSNPENTSATLHDQSTTTSTTSSFTSEAWSPILSARHARARSNSNSTRNSSVSTQQEATGSTARLSALGSNLCLGVNFLANFSITEGP